MKKKKKNGTYLTDNPISTKSEDHFDRWSFAERIAHTIGRREDSGGLVIAIYGEWGDGKTSTLNLMEKALKSYEDIVVTRFNPWYFQSESILVSGFFNHLADTIEKSMPTLGEKIIGFVKTYGGMLATVATSVTLGGVPVSISPGAVYDAASGVSDLGLGELQKRIEGILAKSEKRIVVLVDDIDRLDKDEIQQIFKLVRLSGSFEKVTYVLAFDEKMVAAALRDKYPSGSGDPGLKFIEKIVQVPLHLPPANKEALLEAIYAEVNKTLSAEEIELSERDAGSIGHEFQTSLGYALRTPRQVKRYANAIMFGLPVLKEEVRIADLLLIEAIRVFYPDMYTLIRDNPDVFLSDEPRSGSPDKDRATVLNAMYKGVESENHRNSLRHLIEVLFPRSSNQGSYGDDWEKTWAEDKRICSRAYFRRYFNYSVPHGDISDVSFSAFVTAVSKVTNKTDIVDQVKKFVKTNGAHAFVEKLVLVEGTLSEDTAKKIAYGIAVNGALFKDNGDPFFSDFSHAVTFIARTHVRIPKVADRDAFATEILLAPLPLPFAIEEFLFMSREDKTPENKQPMSTITQETLGRDLAQRIAKEAAKMPPYTLKYGASRLIWHWKEHGNKEDVRTYFKKRLQKKPGEIADFLSAFVGNSYGSEGKRKSDLRGNEYNLISEIIDPNEIVKAIKKSLYGRHVDTQNTYFNRKLSDEQRIINQFMHIFNSRKIESKKVSEASDSAQDH